MVLKLPPLSSHGAFTWKHLWAKVVRFGLLAALTLKVLAYYLVSACVGVFIGARWSIGSFLASVKQFVRSKVFHSAMCARRFPTTDGASAATTPPRGVKHLVLVVKTEDVLDGYLGVESCCSWLCEAARHSISHVTLFDEDGLLKNHAGRISAALPTNIRARVSIAVVPTPSACHYSSRNNAGRRSDGSFSVISSSSPERTASGGLRTNSTASLEGCDTTSSPTASAVSSSYFCNGSFTDDELLEDVVDQRSLSPSSQPSIRVRIISADDGKDDIIRSCSRRNHVNSVKPNALALSSLSSSSTTATTNAVFASGRGNGGEDQITPGRGEDQQREALGESQVSADRRRSSSSASSSMENHLYTSSASLMQEEYQRVYSSLSCGGDYPYADIVLIARAPVPPLFLFFKRLCRLCFLAIMKRQKHYVHFVNFLKSSANRILNCLEDQLHNQRGTKTIRPLRGLAPHLLVTAELYELWGRDEGVVRECLEMFNRSVQRGGR